MRKFMHIKNKRSFKVIFVLLLISLIFASCRREAEPDDEMPTQSPSPAASPIASPTEEVRKEEPQEKDKDKKDEEVQKPELPEAIAVEGNKEPSLKVYIVQDNSVKEMPFEEYVQGVVAGEIKNDWPIEAIKAQAVIARTFVLQFIEEKGQSKYENAHVSTDIEEAQAWNADAVNDRIRKAVEDTRGLVITYKGEFARTWFHSNAGGKTATPKEGLNYKEEDPPYIQVVDSPDTGEAVDEDAKNWTASFPKGKIIAALQETDKKIKDFKKVSIGETGPSGRAITIKFDNTDVSAAELRLALGTTDMRSTLIDEIVLEGDNVVMKGRGYGHGVGMSQWGAYNMANEGKSAEDIIRYYFKDVDLVTMWE